MSKTVELARHLSTLNINNMYKLTLIHISEPTRRSYIA